MTGNIVVSYSELDTFRQCPHKHYLAYKQRWTGRPSRAQSIGSRWHELMALHYAAIRDEASDMLRKQAISAVLLMLEDNEIADLLAWMYDGYEAFYGKDPQWTIAGIEDQRLIRLPTINGAPSRFWLRMRVDLLVCQEVAGKLRWWVVDHKSGRDLPTDKELDIDDQFSLYTWGLRMLGVPVFGQVFSAARTYQHVDERPLEERFARLPLYRTHRELEVVAREAYTTARTAYLYDTKTLGPAPRAPDSDRCRWRCPFTEPCMLGRKAGETVEQEYLSTTFRRVSEEEQLALRGYPAPMMP